MATVVGVLLAVTVAGMIAAAVATVFGRGSIMGVGHAWIYVDVPDVVGSSDLDVGRWSPHADVSANTTGYRFGVAHPDVEQRVWYTLTLLPGFVLFAGALLLAYQLIRGAERDGIYTSSTARRLRTLGWYLLIGAVVKMVTETVAANRLLAAMVSNQVDWIGPMNWDIPWTVLLTAAGLLSFARIMRIGAEMRDELQATV